MRFRKDLARRDSDEAGKERGRSDGSSWKIDQSVR